MYIGTLTLSLFLAVFGAVLLAVVLGNQMCAAAAAAGRRVRQVAAGRPDAQGRAAGQGRARWPDPFLCRHDPAAGRCPQAVERQHGAGGRGARQPADHPGQPDRRRHRARRAGRDPSRPTRAPPASCACRWPHSRAAPGRGAGLQAFGAEVQQQFDASSASAASTGWTTGSSPSSSAATPAGGRAAPTRQRHHAGRARRQLPGRTGCWCLTTFRNRLGPARAGLGRGGAPAGARDQEPAHADPAVGRAAGDEALGQGAAAGAGHAAKSVKTIVDQVDAMKRLVNEFRDYARLPAAELKPLDLNALVPTCCSCMSPARQRPCAGAGMELDAACPPHPGRRAATAPGRAQPAAERAGRHAASAGRSQEPPPVVIARSGTRPGSACACGAATRGADSRRTSCKRAFEPYVTTKAKGTGLGLAVVKKIADEHGARIDMSIASRMGVWARKCRYHSPSSERPRSLTTLTAQDDRHIHGKHSGGRRRARHSGSAVRRS
jgi:hypothetical protein